MTHDDYPPQNDCLTPGEPVQFPVDDAEKNTDAYLQPDAEVDDSALGIAPSETGESPESDMHGLAFKLAGGALSNLAAEVAAQSASGFDRLRRYRAGQAELGTAALHPYHHQIRALDRAALESADAKLVAWQAMRRAAIRGEATTVTDDQADPLA